VSGATRLCLTLVLALAAWTAAAGGAQAARATDPVPAASAVGSVAAALEPGTAAAEPGAADQPPAGEGRLATAVEIALLLTLLSILPAILITVTSFTRIVIVLSFVRRALSVNELPPNPVLIGLALFLTAFVMAPVGKRIYEHAWAPYRDGTLDAAGAGTEAWGELRGFLVANTRESELELFASLAGLDGEHAQAGGDGDTLGRDELPLQVVVPAFVLSELKTAFQMGFLLFLPFLVIDLVVSSILLSMGMFMLPPVMISTPFKILIFVLVDGWHLVCESLVTSFIT
jgi:flagellar biosynthesis protein FliP